MARNRYSGELCLMALRYKKRVSVGVPTTLTLSLKRYDGRLVKDHQF